MRRSRWCRLDRPGTPWRKHRSAWGWLAGRRRCWRRTWSLRRNTRRWCTRRPWRTRCCTSRSVAGRLQVPCRCCRRPPCQRRRCNGPTYSFRRRRRRYDTDRSWPHRSRRRRNRCARRNRPGRSGRCTGRSCSWRPSGSGCRTRHSWSCWWTRPRNRAWCRNRSWSSHTRRHLRCRLRPRHTCCRKSRNDCCRSARRCRCRRRRSGSCSHTDDTPRRCTPVPSGMACRTLRSGWCRWRGRYSGLGCHRPRHRPLAHPDTSRCRHYSCRRSRSDGHSCRSR